MAERVWKTLEPRNLELGPFSRPGAGQEPGQEIGAWRHWKLRRDEDDVLWPGLSVSTRLLVETLKDVIVVPADAVQRGPNGLYAYVVGDGNKVEMRDIKVAQEADGLSVVSQGLSPGESVVTEGQYRLQDGSIAQPAPTPTTSPAKSP